jgi:peptidoglycan/LPS O-acetylase OafA/YrhL
VRSLRIFINEISLREAHANSPLWTIQVELACSLLLPILLYLLRRYSKLKISTAIVLACLITMARGFPDWVYAPCWLFAFFLGYQAFEWHSYSELRMRGWLVWIFLFMAISSVLLSNEWRVALIACSIFLSLFILSIANKENVFGGILNTKALNFLGKISFSIYLFHMPVILLIWSMINRCCPKILYLYPQMYCMAIIFALSLIVTINISILGYVFVEKPFNDIGHLLSSKWLNYSKNASS